MQNTNPFTSLPVVLGFFLSAALAVVTFLAPTYISHELAVLLVTVINLASASFGVRIANSANTEIASLRNAIASLDAVQTAAVSKKLATKKGK